jgi:hypothetical protein
MLLDAGGKHLQVPAAGLIMHAQYYHATSLRVFHHKIRITGIWHFK